MHVHVSVFFWKRGRNPFHSMTDSIDRFLFLGERDQRCRCRCRRSELSGFVNYQVYFPFLSFTRFIRSYSYLSINQSLVRSRETGFFFRRYLSVEHEMVLFIILGFFLAGDFFFGSVGKRGGNDPRNGLIDSLIPLIPLFLILYFTYPILSSPLLFVFLQ